jgi:hypothetical protein
MKNLIFTPILILISISTFAQNWSPIRVNQKMNYQHSDSSYISHTIWVDSAGNTFEDSTFFLNLVVKDIPDNPEIVLRNQPQFLGQIMIKDVMGNYFFIAPMYYCILTSALIGESWVFDLDNNVYATLNDITEEEIFGVLDSVKMIELSDGNEILLSKNFGFLKFPDFEYGGYFELVGIQDTEYGQSVPGILDIYNFEIGEIYQTFYDYSTVNSGSSYDFRYKKTVVNKQQFEDSIQYEFHVLRHKREYWANNTTHHYYANYYEDLTIKNDPANRENKFNKQLDIIEDTYVWIGTMELFTYCRIYPDENVMIVKAFGDPQEDNDLEYLYFALDADSDTLYKLEDSEMVDGYQGFTFINGLGLSYTYSEEFWETYIDYYLEGYVKDGDTVGIITPDSVLLAVGISNQKIQNYQIAIYPNPASADLNINIDSFQKANYQFELRNSLGQLIRQIEINSPESTIRIDDLQSGLYFYSIKNNSQIVRKNKLIIH